MTSSQCLIMKDGSELWIKNKKLHRLDGPAVFRHKDKHASFFIEVQQYSFKEYVENVKPSQKQLTLWLLKYNSSY